MRILYILILLLISYIPTYAIEYIHTDGSHNSINMHSGLPTIIEKTLEAKIKTMLPNDSGVNTVSQTPSMAPSQNLDSEYIDTKNWEHSIYVKSMYSDSKISSFLITTYEYTGGAHGSSARIGLVIDNASGKILSLGDFYDTSKLVKKLAPIWQKQIRSHLLAILGNKKLSVDEKDWIRDGTSDIQQYQSFIITPKLLIVYGQQYQHNAYAYGMQTLIYPRLNLVEIAK